MNAKDYVQQIKKIDTLIKNKGEEAKKSAKMGVNCSAARELCALIEKKSGIIANIERLREDEYDVLHKRYVQGKTFYEIADERGISYSNATTIHGRALLHLNDIINPKTCDIQ